jgi:hypothetical protein
VTHAGPLDTGLPLPVRVVVIVLIEPRIRTALGLDAAYATPLPLEAAIGMMAKRTEAPHARGTCWAQRRGPSNCGTIWIHARRSWMSRLGRSRLGAAAALSGRPCYLMDV